MKIGYAKNRLVQRNVTKNSIKSLSQDSINNKSIFKSTLNDEYKTYIKAEIEEYIKEIHGYSKRFIANPSYENLLLYKNHIKAFFSYVNSSSYKIKDIYGSKMDYKIVILINKKLEELSTKVLQEEKDGMDLLESINEIKGLLVNFLM